MRGGQNVYFFAKPRIQWEKMGMRLSFRGSAATSARHFIIIKYFLHLNCKTAVVYIASWGNRLNFYEML